jgi:acetylornithine deacetylase/succinyl-diaminopimelate desuccinylase-like protein
VEAARETLLANLVMIGEIPAPTFGEQRRIQFLQDRFTEAELTDCSTDEMGNGIGLLRGTEGERNILVVAHADTVFDETTDHTITVQEDRITGPGIGDNSLGLAVLASLPALLNQLDLRLRSNLVLLGSTRSLGRGNLAGLRFFLDNAEMPFCAGVCLEGVQLGRLSYASLGMLRAQISVTVPAEYDWTRFGARSAILTLNEVINRILAIPLPRRPRTSILLGSVEGGESFDTLATQAVLRFEVRSESAEIVHQVAWRIEQITEELSAETSAGVVLETLAQRKPGGVPFGHPLIQHTREIMTALGIEPRIAPSMSELSTFIQHEIPALTLGLTTGEQPRKPDETLYLEPMYTGLAQLIGTLLAIDEGLCDEQD